MQSVALHLPPHMLYIAPPNNTNIKGAVCSFREEILIQKWKNLIGWFLYA